MGQNQSAKSLELARDANLKSDKYIHDLRKTMKTIDRMKREIDEIKSNSVLKSDPVKIPKKNSANSETCGND